MILNKSQRQFRVDDNVYVKNLPANTPRWIPGIVRKVTGPLSYVVELLDGRTVRRHVDHVRKRETPMLSSANLPSVCSGMYADRDEPQPCNDEQVDLST